MQWVKKLLAPWNQPVSTPMVREPKVNTDQTDSIQLSVPYSELYEKAIAQNIMRKASDDFYGAGVMVPTTDGKEGDLTAVTIAMDSAKNTVAAMDSCITNCGSVINTQNTLVSAVQLSWYSAQSFIGFQMCAILSQHWLIMKACERPAKDAISPGYNITVNDGTELKPEILDAMRIADKEYKITENLVEFIRTGKIFGIRIAKFVVESSDPNYYEHPFNIDGVTEGSYKGIAQIDPYWITPELDFKSASDPGAIDFYVPTWWRIGGQRIHRTHLIIFRNGEVVDVLKPTYFYAGVSVPQKIYERVYAAERVANEAPQLAMSKRTTFINTDTDQAALNSPDFITANNQIAALKNNYGTHFLGPEDKAQQFDTSLADFDALLMNQYQLVAAGSNVPADKLIETAPKGFNTTGEFEEKSYHQELKGIQTGDLTPFIERHHLLVIRSKIAPQFSIAPFATSITWNPLAILSAKEEAEINKIKADSGAVLVASGAIDGEDERNRIIVDPNSGYTGISPEVPIIQKTDRWGNPIEEEEGDDPFIEEPTPPIKKEEIIHV